MTFQSQATVIADTLDTISHEFAHERADATMREIHNWYTKSLSRLSILTGDKEILYVTGSIKLTEPNPNARVTVFTADRVITAYVDLIPPDTEPQVSTFARSQLRSISIEDGGANPFRAEGAGHLRLRLTYEGGNTVVLPHGHITSAAEAALANLIPILLEDLDV